MAKKNKKKRSGPTTTQLALRLLDHTTLDVRSASAIAPLGGGAALVVDDDEGIYFVDARGASRLLRGSEDAKALGDLESVCVDGDGSTVYAVSEEKGRVFSFVLTREGAGVALSASTLLGVVERPGASKNKGWEGASYLKHPDHFGGAPCLVLAHERDPMAVGVFTLPDLRRVALVELDGALGDLMGDVSDVAVCPATGSLFLLSDDSERVVEARMLPDGVGLEVVGAFDLPLDDGEKPEGIAFESDDRLVVVTDASSRLLRFAVGR